MKETALAKALQYLSRRSLSIVELRTRLSQAGFSSEETESALGRAEEMGYLNDRTLAQDLLAYLRDRKQMGTARVRVEMRRRGISQEIIQEFLEQEEEDEDKKALQSALHAKLRSLGGDAAQLDERNRARIARYLKSKGFSDHDILEALERLPGNQ